MPVLSVDAKLSLDTDSRCCTILINKDSAVNLVNRLQTILDTTGLQGLDVIPKAYAEREIKKLIAGLIRNGYISFASMGDAFKLIIRTKPE